MWASIYVEAKALAVMSPLLVMAMLLGLLARSWTPDDDPRDRRGAEPSGHWQFVRGRNVTVARYVLGGIVAACLAASAFLALRAAPVGFDQRGAELEGLSGLIPNDSVVFFGVDRFSGYWLRGTLMRSPGGYVPAEVKPRRSKVWQQGQSMDFDTLRPQTLDDFQ